MFGELHSNAQTINISYIFKTLQCHLVLFQPCFRTFHNFFFVQVCPGLSRPGLRSVFLICACALSVLWPSACVFATQQWRFTDFKIRRSPGFEITFRKYVKFCRLFFVSENFCRLFSKRSLVMFWSGHMPNNSDVNRHNMCRNKH